MTEALITIARSYIEDATEPYTVSDTIIERHLNKSRTPINDLRIYAEDYGYGNESSIYLLNHSYIMNLTLEDGDGNIISTDNYTLDAFNGLVTFGGEYTIPDSVYASFTYHDLFDAIANIWLYRASLATIWGKKQLGDEQLPQDKYHTEYCIKKYWAFRQSTSTQMER
jgi:hypothetical protein